MTDLPRIGQAVEAKAEPGDDIMWSVTTVISILDKSGPLIPWAVGETAERLVANVDGFLYRLDHEGPAEAIEWIKKLRWNTDGRLKAKDLGTLAHHLFDEYAITGTRPDVTPDLHPEHRQHGKTLDDRDVLALRRMLDQFDRFLDQYQPDYHATEVVVYDPKERLEPANPAGLLDAPTVEGYGIAGQCDAFMGLDGVPLITDYKTSVKSWTASGAERGPYPEVGLQLAAYRYATRAAVFRARRYKSQGRRYYLLSEAEKAAAVPVPEVDGGVAIYVTPDRFGVYPVRCGPEMFEAFLYCLEAARWVFNEAKNVVGNPMPALHEPEPADDPFAGLPV